MLFRSVTVRNMKTGETDLYQSLISTRAYESLYVRHLTPVRMTAGTHVHVHCRLLNMKQECVHANHYLFASDEDDIPFDKEMCDLIHRLFDSSGNY